MEREEDRLEEDIDINQLVVNKDPLEFLSNIALSGYELKDLWESVIPNYGLRPFMKGKPVRLYQALRIKKHLPFAEWVEYKEEEKE